MRSPLERAHRVLGRHAPELIGSGLAEVGHGLGHTAYLADVLVVWVGSDVRREARFLRELAPRLPVPVPEPRFVDHGEGVLGYPRLPGDPLLGRVFARCVALEISPTDNVAARPCTRGRRSAASRGCSPQR
jgi:hypothetical protein